MRSACCSPSALLVIYAAVLQWPERLPSGAGVAAGVLLLLMLPIPSGSAIDNPLAGAGPLLLGHRQSAAGAAAAVAGQHRRTTANRDIKADGRRLKAL